MNIRSRHRPATLIFPIYVTKIAKHILRKFFFHYFINIDSLPPAQSLRSSAFIPQRAKKKLFTVDKHLRRLFDVKIPVDQYQQCKEEMKSMDPCSPCSEELH
jgi:hypothetical protein